MIQVCREHDVTVIELDAEHDALDRAKFQQARDLLLSTMQSADPPLVVLDLSKTAYMGSAFIEVMSRAGKRACERGGRMVLCGLQPFCAEVLAAAHLDSVWDTFGTRDEAIAALMG
ncbi:MAG: STAS domain-containing protein [Planctomycetia bacterium]|nr:STAS domain-containing protein [Planctomycetia bacterium]